MELLEKTGARLNATPSPTPEAWDLDAKERLLAAAKLEAVEPMRPHADAMENLAVAVLEATLTDETCAGAQLFFMAEVFHDRNRKVQGGE